MSVLEREAPSEEKRTVARRHLVFYLRVFDGMSSRILGHLADISARGVMLISDAPVSENQQYRLRMRLPKEIAGRAEILLDATSRWCRKDTNPDFYICGFQIHELEAGLEVHVQQLISDFSMEETLDATTSEQPACNLTHTKGR